MNSLDKRLSKLEECIESPLNEMDLITKLRKKQNVKKETLLSELRAKYIEYLDSQTLIDNVDVNLIEVLWYTMKYVTRNKLNIGRLLEIKVNDETFDDVVLYLININVSNVSEEFICKGIKFLNSLEMKQDEIDEIIVTKKKSWFGKNKNIE